MKRVFFVLSIVLATSMGLQTSIVVLDVPSSIRQEFGQEHPFASHPIYRFSTDDAGIFYEVTFTEAGGERMAEYHYSNQDWMLDVVEPSITEGDKFALVGLGTHKR
jgi:hypothetical protein